MNKKEIINIIKEMRNLNSDEVISVVAQHGKEFIDNYNRVFDVEPNSPNDGEAMLLSAMSILLAADGLIDEKESAFVDTFLTKINTSQKHSLENLKGNLKGIQESIFRTLEAIANLFALLKRTAQYSNFEQSLGYILIGVIMANSEINVKEVEIVNKYFDMPCSVKDFATTTVTDDMKISKPITTKTSDAIHKKMQKSSNSDETYLPLIKQVRKKNKNRIPIFIGQKIRNITDAMKEIFSKTTGPGSRNIEDFEFLFLQMVMQVMRIKDKKNMLSYENSKLIMVVLAAARNVASYEVEPLPLDFFVYKKETFDASLTSVILALVKILTKCTNANGSTLINEIYVISSLLDDDLRAQTPKVINNWIINNLPLVAKNGEALINNNATDNKEKRSSYQTKPISREGHRAVPSFDVEPSSIQNSGLIYEKYKRYGQIEIRILGDHANVDTLTIPDSIEGYPVTAIYHRAFLGKSRLSAVELPSSLVSIGNEAFKLCNNLDNIIIPSSVEGIGMNAFESTKMVYCQSSYQPAGWDIIWRGKKSNGNPFVKWGHEG